MSHIDNYLLFFISIAAAAVISFLLFRLKKFLEWKKIIDQIPGPDGVPFLGIALQFFTSRENVSKVGRALGQYYADRYPLNRAWFGPIPMITIFKAEAAKVILENTKEIAKSSLYNYLHNWIGDGLLTSTGSKWQHRRKLITPSFHFRILDKFLVVMNEQADILVQILRHKCKDKNNAVFDIYPFITRCTLDIICETAMGQKVKAQSNVNSEYVTAVNNLTEITNKRMLRPWLALDFIFRLTAMGRLEKKSIEIVHKFTNRIIKMKKTELIKTKASNGVKTDEKIDEFGLKRRVALLDMLLENSMQSSDSEKALTDDDIREEVDTFMFEGHDTTSVGIGWTLYCIGQYPEVQQKIVEEMQSILGDEERAISREDLQNMKYLECVIKESLRLYPPVPMFGRMLSEELNICGYKIPSGTTVIVSPYWVHRDPVHFQDPLAFIPERFLPENSANRDPFAYVPFSAGLRNCIGQKFALMEEKTVVGQIIRNFKVTTEVDPEINHIFELVLRPLRGINLKLEPRL